MLCCNMLKFLSPFAQETAQWDELNTQQLALTPERPAAAATGPPDNAADLPAAAVAAAREEAHQQLTLQVGVLCATMCPSEQMNWASIGQLHRLAGGEGGRAAGLALSDPLTKR